MQLKMVARRSLNGSMTVVGDLAQATGPWAPDRAGTTCTDHLPDRRPSRVIGLSVGYRIPAQIMQLADRVMHAATPGLRPPEPVRDRRCAARDRLGRRPPTWSARRRRGDRGR